MRVLESTPVGQTVMGKRKHKLRKSSQDAEIFADESSDESTAMAGRGCPHLNKSLNQNSLRKALKQLSIGDCVGCAKEHPFRREKTEELVPESVGAAVGGAGAEASVDPVFESEITVWLCLQCGYQGCDRNSPEKHALKHFQTPRSGSHAMVININTWMIWCYDCDDEVTAESSRKLQDCVEMVKKQATISTVPEASERPPVKRSSSFKQEAVESADTVAVPIVDPLQQNGGRDGKGLRPRSAGSSQASASVTQALPKVKGLSNLGNTCFFNAVMQNLSQTYALETVMKECAQKGVQLNLAGREGDDYEDADADISSDEDNGKRIPLEPLSLSLTEGGQLTCAVMGFLRDMHASGRSNTISPSSLFGQVCRKAPRFKGFQQQDSHELLRHLLDGMKAEEVRRAQAGLLRAFHLPDNVSPRKVEEETRVKLREYGQQVKITFVDSVFGGSFISTVLCEECQVPSQILEPFLDISLPIMEEKTVRPNSGWIGRRKDLSGPHGGASRGTDEHGACSAAGPVVADKPSKHLAKKAKKLSKKEAKRKAKRKGARGEAEEADTEAGKDEAAVDADKPTVGGDSQSHSEEEISDADIEDNLDSEQSSRMKSSYVGSEAGRDTDSPDQSHPGQSVPDSLPSKSLSCPQVLAHQKPFSRTNSLEEPVPNVQTDRTHSPSLSSSSTYRAGSSLSQDKDTSDCNLPSKCDISELTDALSSVHLNNSTSELMCNSTNAIASENHSLDSQSEGISNSLQGAVEAEGHESSSTSHGRSTPVQRSRSHVIMEARLHAMTSLGPRYHAVSQECSLQSCLNQFTAAELLTGPNKFCCRICSKRKATSKDSKWKSWFGTGKKDKVYTNASKQSLIFSPPAVLTVHLKRFQQVGFTLRKVNRHVEFPMLLDLAPYCSSLCMNVRPGQTQVLYALYGVVEHSGRLTGGHYTAYVKVRPNSTNNYKEFLQHSEVRGMRLEKILETLSGAAEDSKAHIDGEDGATGGVDTDSGVLPGKWYYISDSRVNEVSNETNVLRCQAYILFYERIC